MNKKKEYCDSRVGEKNFISVDPIFLLLEKKTKKQIFIIIK